VTYPDPRYLGDGGEVSAVFRLGTTEPAVRSDTGDQTHFIATHALTGGDFGIYRFDLGPRSPGARIHFHRTISESFLILDGEVQLFDGEQWITAHRDDFLFVPGAPREDYFERLAEMARRGGPDFDRFLAEHDNHFVDV
jgi:hypothetical protein